jgi:hypothetical protein
MRALCTEFIVTCTDSLGVHGERDDDRTRNASLVGCCLPCDEPGRHPDTLLNFCHSHRHPPGRLIHKPMIETLRII